MQHRCRISSVGFLFDKNGLITVQPSAAPGAFDELFEVAVEHGAEDVREAESEEGEERIWEVRATIPHFLRDYEDAHQRSFEGCCNNKR